MSFERTEREEWQDPKLPVSGPNPVTPGTWVLHYPGSSRSWFPRTVEEEKAYLRAIQADYKKTRGYSIGYSWGVSQSGRKYEIRGDDIRVAANPGRKLDVGNFNQLSQAIFVMVGNADAATPEAVASINEIVASRSGWNIVPHMDTDYTICPGAGLLDQLRSGVIGHGNVIIPPLPNPEAPEGYNPPDEWSLYPLDGNKPTVREGDNNQHVMYLNDVYWFFASGGVQRSWRFGNDTKAKTMAIQDMFGITVDGVVGPAETWPVIDFIVFANVTQPGPVDPPTEGDVEAATPCHYYVNQGDSPWSVGELAYGSGQDGARLIPASSFNTFSTPGSPVLIEVPETSGLTTIVLPGEYPLAILRRMAVDEYANLDTYYAWNGGEDRTLQPGDRVYLPIGL